MSRSALTVFILGQVPIWVATSIWLWSIVTVSIEDGDGFGMPTAYVIMSLCTAYVAIKLWKGIVKLFSNAY